MTTHVARSFEQAFDLHFGSTADFLCFFKSHGCYLDDLSHVPVDALPPGERREILKRSVPGFAQRLRDLKPELIVVALKKIEKHVGEAVRLAGVDAPVYVLPFPGQGHQRAFVEGLVPILREELKRAA